MTFRISERFLFLKQLKEFYKITAMHGLIRFLAPTILACLFCSQGLAQSQEEFLVQLMKYLKDGRINETLILASRAQERYPENLFFQFMGNNPDPAIFTNPVPTPDQARKASKELLELADILSGMGNDHTQASLILCRRLLEYNPESPRIKYSLARQLYQAGAAHDREEAHTFLSALPPIPEDLENKEEITKFKALLALIKAGGSLTPEELKESYPEFTENAGVLEELARNSLADQQCKAAVGYLQAIARARQPRPEHGRLLAEAWSCLGEDEKAASALANSERLTRNMAALRILNLRLRDGNQPEAVKALELMVSESPDYLEAVRLLAGIYYRQGKNTEAVAVYRNYLEAHPENLLIRESAARILLDDGLYDQASVLMAGDYDTETGRIISVSQMIRGNNWQGAESATRNLLEDNPLDPVILYKLIQSLGGQGKISEARKHLRKGLSVYPAHPILKAAEENIEFDYARLLSEQGRRKESIAVYRKLIRINPSSSQYLLNLAYEEMMNGECGQAAGHFRKGLKISPGENWARSGLAYCLMQEWEFDEAVRQMKILVSRSDDPDYLFQLGSIYNQIGETKEGWSLIRKAAKQGHQEAAALVNKRYGKN